ncbi:MAG: 23S rRNA (guanosine(2251)-2'-O)-methyltransferase RlmB [Spirochaetes bacterium]|nr:23S rRNA (guanosine(2251)-2'-O)-methyltransferase RlmB [Spirochaetota bacterium]
MRYVTAFHGIEELVRSGAKGALLVAVEGPRVRKIAEAAAKAGVPVRRVDHEWLDRAAPDNRGAAFEPADPSALDKAVDLDEFLAAFDKPAGLVLVLDHLSDPHNYGAILRSADVFGVDLVITPDRRAAKETEVVARASAGALAWVPVASVPNLPRALRSLKEAGFWCYAANMDGDELRGADLPGRVALVMGAEGAGVSRLLRDTCDGALRIPQRGHVDSLNVSVAAGVFLYELASRGKD